MPVVSADTLQISHIEEVIAGETPATPVFEVWRTTGESLVFSPNVSESAELGGTGRSQKPGNVTGMTVSGDINFELSSFEALNQAISGVLAGSWGQCPLTGLLGGGIDTINRVTVGRELKTYTVEKRFPNPNNVAGAFPLAVADTTPAPAATVTVTFSGGAVTGTGVCVAQLAVDDGEAVWFRVPVAAGDSELEVAAAMAAEIDAHADFTATDAGLGAVDVSPATGTEVTFSFWRVGPDTYYYQRYVGSSYSALNLTTSPNNPVTGSVSVVSGVPQLDDLPISGATYTAAATGAVFTAPEVLDLSAGTVLGVGTHCWTTLTVNIDSQNRGIPCIGTQGEREVVLGTLSATVSGDVYFSDQAILEALLNNETIGDGTITFSNSDAEIYRWDFYGNKPISGELAAGGTGEDLTIPLEMQPTPRVVCDDGAEEWTAGFILSTENTAPPVP